MAGDRSLAALSAQTEQPLTTRGGLRHFRLDNDIRPAAVMGLRTALIRRGPWGVIQQDDPDADRVPTMRIDSLSELPGRISAVNAAAR